MHGFDKAGRMCGVVERLAKFLNVILRQGAAHASAFPYGIKKFFFGDQSPGMLHQIAQDRQGLGAECHKLIVPPELLVRKIEAEGGEDEECRGAHKQILRKFYQNSTKQLK